MTRSTPRSLDRAGLLRATRALARADSRLGRAVARYGPPPMWGRRAGFSTLLRIVLEQQVSLASADAVYRKLSVRLGRVTPRGLLRLDDATLRAAGFSRQKARYGRALATEIVEGRLRLRALSGLGDEEVTTALTRVTGIGPWTANVYLLMALRRPDVWPPGDLALANSARVVCGLDDSPNDETLSEISEAWRPWRSVAARILWHAYLSERRR